MSIWRTIVAWLAALSADPAAIDLEGARSAAAVAAAYAAMRPEDPAPPAPPKPAECPCGGRCENGRYKPDGAIWQPCAPGCRSCQPRASACRCGGNCSVACSCGCRSVLDRAGTNCPGGTCPPKRGG